MSDYYTEVLENVPFKTAEELYEQHLPRLIAVWLAASRRLRTRIGVGPDQLMQHDGSLTFIGMIDTICRRWRCRGGHRKLNVLKISTSTPVDM